MTHAMWEHISKSRIPDTIYALADPRLKPTHNITRIRNNWKTKIEYLHCVFFSRIVYVLMQWICFLCVIKSKIEAPPLEHY